LIATFIRRSLGIKGTPSWIPTSGVFVDVLEALCHRKAPEHVVAHMSESERKVIFVTIEIFEICRSLRIGALAPVGLKVEIGTLGQLKLVSENQIPIISGFCQKPRGSI